MHSLSAFDFNRWIKKSGITYPASKVSFDLPRKIVRSKETARWVGITLLVYNKQPTTNNHFIFKLNLKGYACLYAVTQGVYYAIE